MKQKTFGRIRFWLVLIGLLSVFYVLAKGQLRLLPDSTKLKQPQADDGRKIKGQIQTIFDLNGRPVNQSQVTKGFHRVTGRVKLVAGKATITLNTRTVEGRQDVSFISATTFRGFVSVSDTTNTKTYRVYPRSGKSAQIVSSDAADTTTVGYTLEGE